MILEEGLIPYTEKLAKGIDLIRWKGPGQDWQAMTAEDVVHEVGPLISVPNREVGRYYL